MEDTARIRRRFVAGVALATGLFGLWSLGAWLFGRPELAGMFPGLPPVLPFTALWMLVCAAALPARPIQGRTAVLCSAIGAALSLAQLVVPLTGLTSPWPLANPLTSLTMLMLSVALGLRDHPWRPDLDPSGSLALLSLLVPYFALLGYALHMAALYRPLDGTDMALGTALTLVLVALSTLASRPDHRWVAWWSRDSLGGGLIRRQVPIILLAPSALGLLAVAGEHANLYPHELTIGLILVISGLAGTVHTVFSAHSLDALEQARLVALRDLQGSEAMFRGLMEGASDAILVIDEAGRVAFKNRQVATLFGYDPSELIGMDLANLIPERFRGGHAGLMQAYMQSPRHRELDQVPELFGRRRDGSEFPCEISLSPVETVEGRFVMVLLRDLTERRRAASAIAELNARLTRRNEEIEAEILQRTQELARQDDLIQRAVDHIPAGIAMVDPDLGFRWANPEYARQLGMSLDELLDCKLPEVLPGVHTGMFADVQRLASAPVRLTGTPLVRDGLTSYWDASLVPLFDDGSYQGCIVLANEVTARLELERMQADHIRALERADAVKDEFLNIVSHELRTPIAVLSGTISLLEYEVDGPLNATQLRDVARLRESTDHLLTLVNDLLDMSMIQAGKLAIVQKPLQVRDLVEGAIAFVQPLATERRITIDMALPDDLPVVEADGQRIRQVLINLMSNALKYSPADSSVAIRVHADERALRCEIEDQGPGVPPEDQARIFEKFTRLAGETHPDGAGLGLHICRALIDVHGGEIGVVSDGKSGSTFWFTLPRAR